MRIFRPVIFLIFTLLISFSVFADDSDGKFNECICQTSFVEQINRLLELAGIGQEFLGLHPDNCGTYPSCGGQCMVTLFGAYELIPCEPGNASSLSRQSLDQRVLLGR